MAKKNYINSVHIEGALYQHKLEEKVTGEKSKNPGTKYIQGSIEIATDNAHLNIVPVYFTYVTPVTSRGNQNNTYTVLKNIIDGVYGSIMENGLDNATYFRIDSAVGLNEFYSDRNGSEELVSVKRNEGGFIHVININDMAQDEDQRCKFRCDMVITGYTYKEANEERNTPEKGVIKGCVFNYNKDILPVEFSVTNPLAMQYFENLGVSSSNPFSTLVWGRELSDTVVTTEVVESAWGDRTVNEKRVSRKDYIVTGANRDPYEWDDETFITAAEFKEAIARRELKLATMKKQREDYKANKKNEVSAFQPSADPTFDF